MQEKKVSIIMATYNRAHFIVETLLSIQNQTYHDWECIIVDDGGTDNTNEVIKDILIKDNRFKFFKRTSNYQKGLPGCRNFGLDLMNGDYVVFFDDDDIIDKKCIELSVHSFENYNIDFCCYQKKPFINQVEYAENDELKFDIPIDNTNLLGILKNELPIASCTVVWKKKCFEHIRFIEKLQYAEEWECYSRIISSNFKGISIKNILYYNRKHKNSNTGEFYNDNPIRRKSKSDAILYVVKNLNSKKLLSKPILRYLISISYNFKDFNLFDKIIDNITISNTEKLKWRFFYLFLPYRLTLYKLKLKIVNNSK